MRENQHIGGPNENDGLNRPGDPGENSRAVVRSRGRANAVPARSDYVEVPPYVIGEPPIAPETGGLLEYWRMIRRRKGTLVLAAFLGALAGFLFTLPQTAIYQARAVVEILPMNAGYDMRRTSPIGQSGGIGDLLDI